MIHELPPQVANQIAAGEVVERPASVVKELLENAIDAQATEIDIFVEEAGLKTIQIIDNGIGMSPEDAQIAFKRHATSKIFQTKDLFRIHTLGFRGEALPSIASVSEMSLETSDGKEGTAISLVAGEIVDVKAGHLRKGTSIRVENLFYNTPARLKHIKQLSTELSHITDIVNRMAMGYSHIRFHYAHDGRVLLQTNGKGNLQEVLAAIYGFKQAQDMVKIQAEDYDFSLSGYISKPELTRASRQYLSIFLNGRYIKNYLLNQAIMKGYGSKLMVGRYPLAVLSIQTDAQLLDVNVHPTKQEVRISKEDQLYDLIVKAIQEVLDPMQRIPTGRLGDSKESLEGFSLAEESQGEQVQLKWQGTGLRVEEETVPSEDFTEKGQDRIIEPEASRESTQINSPSEGAISSEYEEAPSLKVTQRNVTFPHLDYIGQLHATYLLCSDETGMYMVDQHAAQERINYEKFRETIGTKGTAVQDLLVPLIFSYSSVESDQIRQVLPALQDLGIGIEEFGNHQFIIHSHPTWMGENNIKDHIEAMIQLAIEDRHFSLKAYREKTAKMMSCRLAIKANHYLTDDQAKQLLEDLSYCHNPYNCAHGRPVLVHYSTYDIERSFKRIQDPHQAVKPQTKSMNK